MGSDLSCWSKLGHRLDEIEANANAGCRMHHSRQRAQAIQMKKPYRMHCSSVSTESMWQIVDKDEDSAIALTSHECGSPSCVAAMKVHTPPGRSRFDALGYMRYVTFCCSSCPHDSLCGSIGLVVVLCVVSHLFDPRYRRLVLDAFFLIQEGFDLVISLTFVLIFLLLRV